MNHKKNLCIIRKGATIHKVEGNALHLSQGYKVLYSLDGGNKWEVDGLVSAPRWPGALEPFPLLKRITRSGIFFILTQADGSRLCIVSKMILKAEAGSSTYRCVFRISKGSRPLNLCQDADGKIYWGEYFLNLRRSEPVHIFCSNNGGERWDKIYTFPKGAICHVHRIIYDPYDNAILVCTGDRNHEVSIFKTTDGFRTLKPLVQGNQMYRTTSIIPLKECILYGTDNPNGINYVMALDRRSGKVDKIQELPGPVLYGCRVGEYTVFSTMQEKRNHKVTIWMGDDKAFRLVLHLKTRKMNQIWREAVGYSTVILPQGIGIWPYLYCTPLGTSRYSNSLIDILCFLRRFFKKISIFLVTLFSGTDKS